MSSQDTSSEEPKGAIDAPKGKFDPTKHIIAIKGKGDYLEVKWRVRWLRSEYPDAIIETELIHLDLGYQASPKDAPGVAVFKATVTLPADLGRATGFGSETAVDFRDFIEKGEVKSIGRALQHLGYSLEGLTEDDPDDPAIAARERREIAAPPARPAPQRPPARPAAPAQANDGMSTPQQQQALRALIARRAGGDEDGAHFAVAMGARFGHLDATALSSQQAAAWLRELQARPRT